MEYPKNFYICKHCGNLVDMVINGGIVPDCCGEPMHLITPNSKEAATEKHIPVATKDGKTISVTVGSVAHPMLEEHYIQWVYLRTKNAIQRVDLKPGEEPACVFALAKDESVFDVYEYCNLHGLWVYNQK